jgi:hypothetical protein
MNSDIVERGGADKDSASNKCKHKSSIKILRNPYIIHKTAVSDFNGAMLMKLFSLTDVLIFCLRPLVYALLAATDPVRLFRLSTRTAHLD